MRRLLTIPVLLALAVPAFAQTPTRDDAKHLVKDAVAFLKKNGKEKFCQEVTGPKGQFHFTAGTKKGLYIFVYDEKGVVVAHGVRAELVGKNRWTSKDPDGKPWIQDWTKLVQTAKDHSGWIEYKELNPAANNAIQKKASFVELKDGLVVGCGIYF